MDGCVFTSFMKFTFISFSDRPPFRFWLKRFAGHEPSTQPAFICIVWFRDWHLAFRRWVLTLDVSCENKRKVRCLSKINWTLKCQDTSRESFHSPVFYTSKQIFFKKYFYIKIIRLFLGKILKIKFISPNSAIRITFSNLKNSSKAV